jgi:DNA repair protein SbcD/Mre11
MPRLLHVSDTHLGMQAYARVTPEGLNQREVDLQDAFRRVVDRAIADPPALFLHTGDLFDHPRPTNRAIAFALHEIRRLSEARIPTILVSGNHDAPRMRETGSIFRVFDGLPHVTPVYQGEARRLEVGGFVVHAAPQAVTQEAFLAQLRSCRPQAAGPPQVLAVHGTVLGVDGLFTSEFNEYQIPLGELRPEWDYVALGHFHSHRRVTENAYYAGSTEYTSFNETDTVKASLDVEVDRGHLRVTPQPTHARPLMDLGVVDAGGQDADAVADAVAARVAGAPEGAVARLTVERVERAVGRTVDWPALRGLRPDLVHLELRVRVLDDGHRAEGALELGAVAQEFDSFLERYPLPPNADRSRLREAALRVLGEAGGGADAA